MKQNAIKQQKSEVALELGCMGGMLGKGASGDRSFSDGCSGLSEKCAL